MIDFDMGVSEALTGFRVAALANVAERLSVFQRLAADAVTTEMIQVPRTGRDAERWRRMVDRAGDAWVFTTSLDGVVFAVDEPSEAGRQRPAEAVVFPEIHTRLVAWWLVHAWRVVDLFEDTLTSLMRWRVTVAPVTTRALLEEVGCLLYEARQLERAWAEAKALPESPLGRPTGVRAVLNPVLTNASFGTRLQAGGSAKAVNVLTYVGKLAKATGNDSINTWYDWLSDAAHPAFGARIAMGSSPAMHETGAVILRFYARRPVFVHMGREVGTDLTVAHIAADACAAVGIVAVDLLEQTLRIVDDFGLTTRAATLTERQYWRNFAPVKGARVCPCGRGKWSQCGHRWGQAPPSLSVAQTSTQ